MNERLMHRQALAWAISVACAGGASAATITVGTPVSCDLADAVASANSDASVDGCSAGSGADLILLPAETHFPNFSTAPVPPITADLTILGHALGTSGVNCEGGGQPFFIGDDASAPVVVLERFSIQSCGYAGGAGVVGAGGAAGMGGAVFVYDGDVTLRAINISGSSVAGGLGGGPIFDGGGGAGGGLHGAGGAPGAASDSLLTPGSGGGGGANASVSIIVPGGAAGAPNGGNGGTGGGFVPLPGAGGFGGGGGGGASLLANLGGQAGASGGFAGGGGGGGATNTSATTGAIAGRGGDGGFGGGGGRGGSSFNAAAGAGGAGGFGGGGGGRGYSEFGGLPAVGVSGFGAQAANVFTGGQGAAFGGALFVRAGTVTLVSSGFANNSANGGSAAGLGGAVFVIDQAAADAHNAIEGASRQGMPEVLPEVSGCSVAFSGNSASSQASDDSNNHDVYGTSRAALVEPCKDIFRDGFE